MRHGHHLVFPTDNYHQYGFDNIIYAKLPSLIMFSISLETPEVNLHQ